MTRSCPAGCGRTQPAGKLMCGPCWREVPRDLQIEVYRTWRRWKRDFGDVDAMLAYRQASNAAVSAIA